MPDEEIAESSNYQGLMATRFQTSVSMSTYLVTFIVCDFDHIENRTANGHLVRMWGLRKDMPHLHYALDVATHLLEFAESYFDMPDPMPKQDLIALPRPGFEGMETWGIMTFNVASLRFDRIDEDELSRDQVVELIARVVGLSWFGNLATFQWWSDVWLRGAFGTYFSHFFKDRYLPEMERRLIQSTAYIMRHAMAADVTESSRPLITDVAGPDDLQDELDNTNKGMSIVWMMSKFMGANNFQRALQTYVKGNEFGSVVTSDLWEACSKVDGFSNIKNIMATWTLQKGYPYINVTLQYDDNTKLTTVDARQYPFPDDPLQGDTSQAPFDYTWYVPLQYVTSIDPDHHQLVWMNRTGVKFQVKIDLRNQSNWTKFNSGMTGYFRVTYPDDMWSRMSAVLKTDVNILPPFDRFNLITDAFRLSEAGLIAYASALDMASYMYLEERFPMWETFIQRTANIRRQFQNHDARHLLEKFIITIVKPITDKLGWESKGDHYTTALRLKMVPFMCSVNEASCLETAGAKFRQWIDSGKGIDTMLSDTVYEYGMQTVGTDKDWEKVLSRYKAKRDFSLIKALARSKHSWIILKLLNMAAFGEHVISPWHMDTLLRSIARNPLTRDIIWQWLGTNWQNLRNNDRISRFHRDSIFETVTSFFNTEEQLKEVEAFLEHHPDRQEESFSNTPLPDRANAGMTRSRKISILKTIRSNIDWMDTNYEGIVAWLKAY